MSEFSKYGMVPEWRRLNMAFRPYCQEDYSVFMRIFDGNCPAYFAPGERKDYEIFLESAPDGYEVCEVDGHVRAVFGLLGNRKNELRLNWIMVDSQSHGLGIGAKIMERVIQSGRTVETTGIGLSTSQKVAPFFEKYGALATTISKDGYGPGLDCVDMVLPLQIHRSGSDFSLTGGSHAHAIK